ncbi:MAG TPA: hypothetical protein PKC54_08850 [Ferruginibacter sp.]|nr:hypothetical protein [Ferruginibacter sp.]
MNPNKALWEKGDFTQLAKTMRESGEALFNSQHKSTDININTTSIPATFLRVMVNV